ncbi:N-formylglutamate amidohydrolase [uncultured Pontibacter sp.]|uniref:N-formylglutamate amidohydrolase n=1 Tax=uncultured Pontibacter sp. TaxID=453356 RepID=UPI00260ED128|nr:N-formylglutamate amidohydrolase [uncultured Pontibacter sp.]
MNTIILHIPHSSTTIPLTDGYTHNSETIDREVNLLTDWFTDELFAHENAIRIVSPFSRVFCDVERFPDDADEVMAQYGMGMLYTKTDDGLELRNVNAMLRERIKRDFYDHHHAAFLKAVDEALAANGEVLILDCHSYRDVPFNRDLIKKQPRPDFNIGTDAYHTTDNLRQFSLEFFSSSGYSILDNDPYAGAITPLKYYQEDKRVKSIMLEINRKLYMQQTDAEMPLKSENFDSVQTLIYAFIDGLLRCKL